ncbi:unnamed protein product [Polarella glacialis]|uniref:GH16 domain-containing protein n=1 Tax=Polarella glacialis TaxID=89957 RepID=A0A813E153_POLGL|nr:unnamed protein product [Polarella glacialis]
MASLSRLLLLGAVNLAVTRAAESSLPEEAALASDDACLSGGSAGDGCDLSLRQLRLGAHTANGKDTAKTVEAQNSSSGILGHPTPSKSYPQRTGFTLKLVEQFGAALDLDTDPIWTWSDGGLPEGQVRFAKAQLRFESGNMKIVAEPISDAIRTQPCHKAEVGNVSSKKLVSGEIRARYNQFRYGRCEARLKAPEVQCGNPKVDGNFVATMFVHKDDNFNHWREIDFEITGGSPHSVNTNMIFA